jgi:hypothetical protein
MLCQNNMQQFVTIFVLCGAAGRELFDESESRLSANGFEWERDRMIQNGQLAYWCTFLDVWSMGDSFDRFLGPENEVRKFRAGSQQLACCRRENVRIEGESRTQEEERLKQVLQQARDAYRSASEESYLFQIRSCFDASTGFNPQEQQAGTFNGG